MSASSNEKLKEMGKDRTTKNKGRHDPLYVQMEGAGQLSKKPPRAKFLAKQQKKDKEDVGFLTLDT